MKTKTKTVGMTVTLGGGVWGVILDRKRIKGRTYYQVHCGGAMGNLWYTLLQLKAFNNFGGKR